LPLQNDLYTVLKAHYPNAKKITNMYKFSFPFLDFILENKG